MNRYLLLCIVLLAACGNAPEATPTEEQSQAVVSMHVSTNNIVTMQSAGNRFCRMTEFDNKGGHLSSPQWPNGKWKGGAFAWAADGATPSTNGLLQAVPYGGPAQPPTRTSTAKASCYAFSDWGFGWAASQSRPSENLYLLWDTSYGQEFVSLSVGLWQAEDVFCYLNGFDSMSQPGESLIVRQSEGQWWLSGQGYPRLGGWAKCIFPHRHFTIAGPYRAVSGGANATVSGPSMVNSFCALTMIAGDADQGSASIFFQSGVWKLNATQQDFGQTHQLIVEMTCAVF